MKVYEYLAAGLPVVSTPLPALAGVAEVRSAADAAGIAALLDAELEQDTEERRRRALPRGRGPLVGAAPGGDRGGDRIAVRDLLVTSHTPILRSGRAVRTYGVARALAARGGLDLLYVRFEGDAPDAAFAAIPGIALHEVVSSRGPRRALAYARGRLRGVPAAIARGISPELADAAARLAAEPGRGRVVADGPVAAATLSALARRRPVIYNAHNLESGFRHELDAPGLGSPATLRAFERGLLEHAAESWMVSEADCAAARELCPGARLRLAPNVVDVAAIVPVEPRVEERRAIFVANFAYAPNQDALRFMVEEVLPRVWAELPDARLALAGGSLEQQLPEDPRIELLGFVPDLRAAYATRVLRGRAAARRRGHAAEADRGARLRPAGPRHAACGRRARRARRRALPDRAGRRGVRRGARRDAARWGARARPARAASSRRSAIRSRRSPYCSRDSVRPSCERVAAACEPAPSSPGTRVRQASLTIAALPRPPACKHPLARDHAAERRSSPASSWSAR